jgi:hypothetical protein
MTRKFSIIKNSTLFTTALTTSFLGYYKKSYSACVNNGGTTYLCEGGADVNTSTINLSGKDNATVSTKNGFGINAVSGRGIVMGGKGAISFTDNYASIITANNGANRGGIYISSRDDGATDGSITIDTNGSINSAGINADKSSSGITTVNSGSGATDLEINGNIDANRYGIMAISYGSSNRSDVLITTGSASKITVNGDGSSSSSDGVYVRGAYGDYTTLEINGDIYANRNGVLTIVGYGTSDLLIQIGSESTISSGETGIYAINLGSGTTDLVISGNISGETRSGVQIIAPNNATMTVESGVSISGDVGIKLGDAAVYGQERITAVELNLNGGAATAGAISIIGTSGVAINLGSQNDIVNISGNVEISGTVDSGEGDDKLTLNNTYLTLSTGSTIDNFETLNVTGANILSGDFDFTGFDIIQENGASLTINGDLTADLITVTSNAELKLAGAVNTNSVTISSGGKLNGNGALNITGGDLIVNDGGLVSPGNSVGEITVTSNAFFNSGGNLNAEIDSSGVDLLDISGVATIASGSNLNLSSLDGASGSGVILSASSIVGSFENITSSGPNLLTAFTSADNTTITLVSLDPTTLTPQIQSSANSSILFNDTLNDQIADGAFTKGKNFWIRNINRDSSTNQPNNEFRSKSNGIALGAQMDAGDSYKLGFSLSHIDNNSKAKNVTSFKTGESIFASIYGIYDRDIGERVKFFTSLSLGFGYHDSDSSRLVYNEGAASYANSESKDYDYSATLQIGSKVKIKNDYFIMPRVSASYIHSAAGGFNEESGGASAVKINDYDFATLKTRESVRFGKDGALNATLLNNSLSISPYIEVGFAQEDGLGDRSLNGQFINGLNFTTQLRENSRDFTTTAVGFNAKINKNISAFLSYENSSSNEENRNEVKGGLRVRF